MDIYVDNAAEELLLTISGEIGFPLSTDDPNEQTRLEYNLAVGELFKWELIEKTYSIPPFIVLTKKGRRVIRDGGFVKFKQRELLLEEKELHDAKMSAYYYKTRWWPHIIAAVSLIVSILAIILSLTKN